MTSRLCCAAFLSVALALGISLPSLAAPPPVDAFSRRPLVESPSLSPGGKHLVYLTADAKGHYGLAGVNLASMEPFSVTLEGDDIYDYTWLTEDSIAFNVAMRRKWSRGLYIYKLGANAAEAVNDRDLTTIVSVLEDDRTRMYLWYLAGATHRQKGLALIDTDRRPTGGMGRSNEEFMVVRWISAPPGELHGWQADWTGQVRIAYTFHKDRTRAWIHDKDGDPWEELSIDVEDSGIAGFTQDGRSLYVAHDDGTSSTESLRLFDLRTRELGPVIFNDPDFGLNGGRIRTSRKEAGLVGVSYYRDGWTTRWLNERFQGFQAAVDASFPGRVNHVADWDNGLTRLVVESMSDRHPPAYSLFDVEKNTAVALPAAAPWIDPAQMQPMKPLRYKARDGLQLQGYLTLPAKRADGAKPPLVVHPHGGPWARDVWEWSSHVQFLASRGYAVFQPNYRGSTGFKREVGEKRSDFPAMLNDVIDGTNLVARSGLVDPGRIAIYGGSFGGYLALAGASSEPDRFRCAVSFAGVFDWARIVNQDKYRREARAARHYVRQYVGDPKADAERFDAMSPINHAASIRIPVLLVHGTDDEVVRDEQTKQLIGVLKQHGVAFESLFFKDEGHGFADPGNEAKFLARLEQFLAKHL